MITMGVVSGSLGSDSVPVTERLLVQIPELTVMSPSGPSARPLTPNCPRDWLALLSETYITLGKNICLISKYYYIYLLYYYILY